MQELIAQHGLVLVFLNVLLNQLGIPVPAIPLLIVAGALAVTGKLSVVALLAVAVVACVIGDLAWFVAGRIFGHRVLATFCRVSLTPDSCVRQTEGFFERWGPSSLVFAKFIPGLSTVAPPLAGALRLNTGSFLLFSSFAALIWVAAPIAGGALFHNQIDWLLSLLAEMGGAAFALVCALLAAFVAFKWWERQRFYKILRMARISVAELQRLIHTGQDPVILDVRSRSAREIDGRKIPGAHSVDLAEPHKKLAHVPKAAEIIVYCTCPNEASAARIARLLMDQGFKRVRPLEGGLDAWIAAGHVIEQSAIQ